MKAHKLEVLILDFDDMGADDVVSTLENQSFPNDCIWPNVMAITSREIEWSDEHPLNRPETIAQAFQELFAPKGE
jgi:hypothetical protein